MGSGRVKQGAEFRGTPGNSGEPLESGFFSLLSPKTSLQMPFCWRLQPGKPMHPSASFPSVWDYLGGCRVVAMPPWLEYYKRLQKCLGTLGPLGFQGLGWISIFKAQVVSSRKFLKTMHFFDFCGDSWFSSIFGEFCAIWISLGHWKPPQSTLMKTTMASSASNQEWNK